MRARSSGEVAVDPDFALPSYWQIVPTAGRKPIGCVVDVAFVWWSRRNGITRGHGHMTVACIESGTSLSGWSVASKGLEELPLASKSAPVIEVDPILRRWR